MRSPLNIATRTTFDAADYAASGSTRTQDDWRRENVNALMELCHAAARRYGVRFGAAPAGDPEQNYTLQYSDAARWLRQGTVDYLMPQLYWGQEYIKNGDASHSFVQLAAAWAALPRAAGVKLYAGLGAYRVGAGGWVRCRLGVVFRPCAGRPACFACPFRGAGRGALPLRQPVCQFRRPGAGGK